MTKSRDVLFGFAFAASVTACGGAPEDLATDNSYAASGDVVRTWNAIQRQQAFGNNLRGSRQLSIMHGAMHDAINGADPRYATYLSSLSDPSADPEAAAAAAAHKVLVNFFPSNQANLDAALAASLASIPDGPAEDAGVALGAAVGQEAYDARLTDGFSVPDPFVPPVGPGFWKPTPPAFANMAEPQFQNVTPFLIASRDQFALDPEEYMTLTSEKYTQEFNQVKSVGQNTSVTRTADQTHSAHFWYEGSQIGWSKVAIEVSEDNAYDLHDTARLFALVNMSMTDGFIAGWYWKRLYAFWRPITGIREANTDGNPDTIQDATWDSLRIAPALPDFPSTHSVLGGAAAEVLADFTGSDHHTFCFNSTTVPAPLSPTRCFNSFHGAADDNHNSRLWAGIHWNSANVAGQRYGKHIGQYVRNALGSSK